LWYFEQREWEGVIYPARTLWVLNMSITWPDAPLCFDRQWLADQKVLDLPRVLRGGATPRDYHRLADAYQALIKFTENLRRPGRKRLYPDTASFVAAVHKLYEKADQQGWDLRNESKFSAEVIGGKLEPDVHERTLYSLLDDASVNLADLRERRI
jgi:hypothetical protein